MREITVGSNESGQRLDKQLRKYLKEASDGFIYKMLRKKNITLNDAKAKGSEILKSGDLIRMWFSEDTFVKLCGDQPSSIDMSHITPLNQVDIIYEDDDVLIYNKPSGVLSQKASPDDVSAVEMLIAYLLHTGKISPESMQTFKPAFCNRLDRNTSGILVAGLSLAGLQQISHMFHDRTIKKEYLCIVKGKISESSMIEGYLHKDEASNTVKVSSKMLEDSKPIKTEYTPLYFEEGKTLLLVHLITGRTHQIRAHLSSIGHPILGDYKYGDKASNDDLKKTYHVESQLLHAYRVTWPKITGQLSELSEQVYIAPVPNTFREIMKGYTWEPGNQED